jgi:hypothetical protein
MPDPSNRWFPTKVQVSDPESVERTMRQTLTQLYSLQDQHNALKAQVSKPAAVPTGSPPGSGPTDTQICGLPVAPVDTSQIGDGSSITWSSTNGNFQIGKATLGIGNGANGNLVSPATGTGSGPATPHTVVQYQKVTLGQQIYWIPLVQ